MMYIEHPGIAAREPAALAKWYMEKLGMRLLRQAGETTFFLGFDQGACIEIYAAKTEAPPIANNYVSGLTHIAFYTDSFEETRQRLLAAGVEPAAEPVIRPDLKLALMRDGEGNLFHITQRDRALISARV